MMPERIYKVPYSFFGIKSDFVKIISSNGTIDGSLYKEQELLPLGCCLLESDAIVNVESFSQSTLHNSPVDI